MWNAGTCLQCIAYKCYVHLCTGTWQPILHINATLSFFQIPVLFQLINQMIEQLQRHAKHLKALLWIFISNLIHVTTTSQNACVHRTFVVVSLYIRCHLPHQTIYIVKLLLTITIRI